MAETTCERCLYYGVCLMPSGRGCDEYISDEEFVEKRREEYTDAFLVYLDSFENC